ASVLPLRVKGYQREWLDQLTLSGEVARGRSWGSATSTVSSTPSCLVSREALAGWTALARAPDLTELGAPARALHDLLASRGALFAQELARASGLDAETLERGLAELVARGFVTCDSFAGLRTLVFSAARKKAGRGPSAGRYSLLSYEGGEPLSVEAVARQLLDRKSTRLNSS